MTPQAASVDAKSKATLCFGLLLLLFIQTLTVWIESIYKIGLTKLSMGAESAGLLFVLLPLVLMLCPERSHRRVLWCSVILFLVARTLIPMVGVRLGVIIAGAGTGVFLVALCLILSREFRFLAGDAGVALGVAVLGCVALRAWGATYDFTLGRSGALVGWLVVGIALGLFWNLFSGVNAGGSAVQSPLARNSLEGLEVDPGRRAEDSASYHGWGFFGVARSFGPVVGLFANLTMVYLVLSSPGVVEAWLGFDNTLGIVMCILAMGGAVVILLRGFEISRGMLVAWNVLFGATLVGGILSLRIVFPATAESAAVVVRPENPAAWLLLNLMFLLSPVVLLNVRAACRGLAETAGPRSLAPAMALGGTLLILITIMSIFTNVWGYVGSISAVFRNQFHVPFLVLVALIIGGLLLAGRPVAPARPGRLPASGILTCVTAVLVVSDLTGMWWHRPVSAALAGKAKRLTVLTYNLQQGADLYGNRNWEDQLAFLKEVNADIIGLQESDTPRPSNGNVAAAKYFGAMLGYDIYYGPNTVSGTYGTAILSRYRLKNARTVFTYSEQDEVGTAVVEIEVDGRIIAFFNSHPSGNAPRKRQAQELVRQTMPYEFVIAAGDFNAAPQDESYRIITAQLKESWSAKYPEGVGLLHPVLRPAGETRQQASSGQMSGSGETIALPDRIDHIFVSKQFRVLEAYYLPAPDSQTDHPAHWAVVEWERK